MWLPEEIGQNHSKQDQMYQYVQTVVLPTELLTKQGSKDGQVLGFEAQLASRLRQQVLVSGQILAVPGELERMRAEIGRDVA